MDASRNKKIDPFAKAANLIEDIDKMSAIFYEKLYLVKLIFRGKSLDSPYSLENARGPFVNADFKLSKRPF